MSDQDIHTFFALLDLTPDASLDDIKSSYRILSAMYHPDKYADNPKLRKMAESKMKQLNEAREVLEEYVRHPKPKPSPQEQTVQKTSHHTRPHTKPVPPKFFGVDISAFSPLMQWLIKIVVWGVIIFLILTAIYFFWILWLKAALLALWSGLVVLFLQYLLPIGFIIGVLYMMGKK